VPNDPLLPFRIHTTTLAIGEVGLRAFDSRGWAWDPSANMGRWFFKPRICILSQESANVVEVEG
jgi:hypothetical protein